MLTHALAGAVVMGLVLALAGAGAAFSAEGKAGAKPSASPQTIRLKVCRCIDKEGIGIEAFRLLAPSDWEFESRIRWVLDRPGAPAEGYFRVWNPKGSQEVILYPTQYLEWLENPMVLSMFPVGSKYFGNEIRQPMDAQRAFREIVLPRFRGDLRNMKVVKEEHLDKPLRTPAPQDPNMNIQTDAAKVRIEYDKDGKRMEEEIYGMVQVLQVPVTPPMIFWSVDCIVGFRAEKGQLDANADVFTAIAHSFQLDPQWFNKYNQVVQMLIQNQIQQIRTVGEISRIVSRTNNEISDMMMQSYNERQASQDRIYENLSQTIRGVESYHNPMEERAVEVPSGYNHVWATPGGEYVLSNDPNFNPNVNSNLTWQELQRQQ